VGRVTPAPSATAQKPLWECPRCGKRFVTANMWHSCARFTEVGFFADKEPEVRRLYDKVLAFVAQCGPFTRDVAKTRIAFQVRVRFAGIVATKRRLSFRFWLKHPVSSPRLSLEFTHGNDWVYRLPIRSEADLDDELLGWTREAYAVGQQTHPGPKSERP